MPVRLRQHGGSQQQPQRGGSLGHRAGTVLARPGAAGPARASAARASSSNRAMAICGPRLRAAPHRLQPPRRLGQPPARSRNTTTAPSEPMMKIHRQPASPSTGVSASEWGQETDERHTDERHRVRPRDVAASVAGAGSRSVR